MFRQVWIICINNFRTWRNNWRIVITFCLAFILCFLLTEKAVQFSSDMNTTMNLFEPFIWTFGDSTSILLESLILLLLFCDMPSLGAGAPFYLLRTTKRRWIIGQLFYIVLSTLIYLVFILVATTALCMTRSFLANMWSETAAILGFSPAGKAVALPAMVKTLEMSHPYQCLLTIFLLMGCYTLLSVLLMFAVNIRKSSFWGILTAFAFQLFGFLVNPDTVNTFVKLNDDQQYIANLWAAWISPLQHATYHMHNFGYDLLPRMWMTFVILCGLIVLCLLAAMRGIRKYNFNFTGGGD
jgi:hypothetical protein